MLLEIAVAALLSQAAASPPGVERDIPYVPGGGHQQQLDLWVPRTKGFPTVLFIHGGSLMSEDKDDPSYARLCAPFQAAGVGCANVNYRLARHAKWPAMPKDVAAAFAWVKRNVAVRGGDASKIFLFGHSSGCHLVSLVATDPRYLREHGLSTKDVAGVVAMGCRLNLWNLADRCLTIEQARPYFEADPDEKAVFADVEDRVAANPTLYIGPHVPRFLALVAETERFQPPILEEAAAFVRKLLEAGVEADVEILKDRKHMSSVEKMAEPGDATFRLVLDFIGARP
jgi:acetyl esterase/lipase